MWIDQPEPLCVLPKARATASYTPRNSFIRKSSGSAASSRVCKGGGSGGLSALEKMGEGRYDGRTSDVTDVTADSVMVGEVQAGAARSGATLRREREIERRDDSDDRQCEPAPPPPPPLPLPVLPNSGPPPRYEDEEDEEGWREQSREGASGDIWAWWHCRHLLVVTTGMGAIRIGSMIWKGVRGGGREATSR
ncbi:hypothetical protein BGW80DRAFT_2795 [Lactifluus volemus]|nr:hypothetical protein BGW80DRAFT_2795 [Lactifluus volemus]